MSTPAGGAGAPPAPAGPGLAAPAAAALSSPGQHGEGDPLKPPLPLSTHLWASTMMVRTMILASTLARGASVRLDWFGYSA